MANKIATFQEQPQFSQQLVVGGVEMRLRITYRQRLASWYVDALDLDDTRIATGRRLSPGFLPFLGLALETIDPPALPEDVIWYVVGPTDYAREDLGDTLGLIVFDLDEIPAAATEADQVTVTVAP
jgi:hypothetical protein